MKLHAYFNSDFLLTELGLHYSSALKMLMVL